MKKIGLVITLAFGLLLAISAWAEEEAPSPAQTGPEHPHHHVEIPEWLGAINLIGLIDTRIGYQQLAPEAEGVDDQTVSDMYIYTAGLGAVAAFNPYLSGTLFFLWEEEFGGDYEDFYLDEGYLTFTWQGLFAEIGRHYLPVGQYDTFAVSDPLVLLLTECVHTTLGLGYQHDFFGLSGWVFNGDFDTVDDQGEPDDNTINNYAFRLDAFPLAFQDTHTLSLGGYFLSDATETSMATGDLLVDNYEKNVPLYGGYLTGEFVFTAMFGLGLTGEYATTGEFAEENYLDNASEATAVRALNAELAALIWQSRIQLGFKYESISGLDWLETQGLDPDYEVTRYFQAGGFTGFDPWEHLHLGLQFLHGADNEGNQLSDLQFQTAFEF